MATIMVMVSMATMASMVMARSTDMVMAMVMGNNKIVVYKQKFEL